MIVLTDVSSFTDMGCMSRYHSNTICRLTLSRETRNLGYDNDDLQSQVSQYSPTVVSVC